MFNYFGKLKERLQKVFASNGDILIGSEFNFPMINILWQIVAGTRSKRFRENKNKVQNFENLGLTKETQGT